MVRQSAMAVEVAFFLLCELLNDRGTDIDKHSFGPHYTYKYCTFTSLILIQFISIMIRGTALWGGEHTVR